MIPAAVADASASRTKRRKHSPTRKAEAARESRSRSTSRRQPHATVNIAFASVRVIWSLSTANRRSVVFTTREHLKLRSESEADISQVLDEVQEMRYRHILRAEPLVTAVIENERKRQTRISDEHRHSMWLRHQYKKKCVPDFHRLPQGVTLADGSRMVPEKEKSPVRKTGLHG